MSLRKSLYALALFLTPAIAFAHPGHGDNGLAAGVLHPLTGLDHLLAMFAVGLWAAQQKGAARLALPCTFVGTMLLGGLLGFDGVQLPFIETGIAASVLALGLCVALGGASAAAAGDGRDRAVRPGPRHRARSGVAGAVEPLDLCRWIRRCDCRAACGGLCAGSRIAAGRCAAGAHRRAGFGGCRGVVAGGLMIGNGG
ncbi:hypothetical secreted protein [Pseudomonas knackmussii B13]|uniref:Hypothetical secreted protein n=1 Tax=Pseudomonas knackmussii (strain DSM 6978 / CCUG 54928 / LMG 23759 / B13) TaxID=1301098 RepID=A0A024HPG6_PSEKB|nr:hypothetical secreted protein [Pseudomonas knackmussii B13]